MSNRLLAGAVIGTVLAMATASPQAAGGRASAALHDPDGEALGTVEFEAVPHGVLLTVDLHGLPPGVHAFHVHAVGACEPPFKSAGGHFNPDGAKHGLRAADGPHAGDMPNIHVPASGELTMEIFNSRLRLDDTLFDADGAAIVIHDGPDDYATDPAGAAGARIACGVIKR